MCYFETKMTADHFFQLVISSLILTNSNKNQEIYTGFKEIWLYEVKMNVLELLVYVFSLIPFVVAHVWIGIMVPERLEKY